LERNYLWNRAFFELAKPATDGFRPMHLTPRPDRARSLSLRFEPFFADRIPLALASLMLLATLSVIAATGAFSAHHAHELAIVAAP
jgi:hypothetical protein